MRRQVPTIRLVKLLPDGQFTLIEADEELFVDKKRVENLRYGCWDRWYAG